MKLSEALWPLKDKSGVSFLPSLQGGPLWGPPLGLARESPYSGPLSCPLAAATAAVKACMGDCCCCCCLLCVSSSWGLRSIPLGAAPSRDACAAIPAAAATAAGKRLNKHSLDAVLKFGNLGIKGAAIFACDAARDHRARDTAGPAEGDLRVNKDVRDVLQQQKETEGDSDSNPLDITSPCVSLCQYCLSLCLSLSPCPRTQEADATKSQGAQNRLRGPPIRQRRG